MSLELVLYANLKKTTLDDFTHHVGEYIELSIVDKHTNEIIARDAWSAFESQDRDVVGMGDIGETITLWCIGESLDGSDTVVAIWRGGATYTMWQLFIKKEGSPDVLSSENIRFQLKASYYRRDILNIVLFEEIDSDAHGDTVFAGWLEHHWGDAVEILNSEDAPKKAPLRMPSNANRPPTYSDKLARSTLVHYLVTKHNQKPSIACSIVGDITEKTYRDHRNDGMLLTAAEFAKQWHDWHTKERTLEAEALWHLR